MGSAHRRYLTIGPAASSGPLALGALGLVG
jgi:hypothetical protein